jgi:PAS domain S-box-containing protein
MLQNLLQADATRITLNSWAIGGIYVFLIVITIYVSNIFGRAKKLFTKSLANNYITTEAKLKSIDLNINAIINCDSEGKILTWNRGATKIFGYDEYSVIGKCLNIILPEELRDIYRKEFEQFARTGFSEVFGKTVKVIGITKLKKELPIEVNFSQWKSDDVSYFTAIIIDVTEQKKLEQELEKLMSLYREAESIQRYGAWKWNLITDEVYTTQGFRDIYEIGIGKESYEESISRIHYEDRDKVESIIKQGIKNKSDYSMKYRIIGRNGRVKLVENTARVWIGESGVEKIYGVIKEIID